MSDTCGHCRRVLAARAVRCGRCRVIRYCSRECAAAAVPIHSRVCHYLAAADLTGTVGLAGQDPDGRKRPRDPDPDDAPWPLRRRIAPPGGLADLPPEMLFAIVTSGARIPHQVWSGLRGASTAMRTVVDAAMRQVLRERLLEPLRAAIRPGRLRIGAGSAFGRYLGYVAEYTSASEFVDVLEALARQQRDVVERVTRLVEEEEDLYAGYMRLVYELADRFVEAAEEPAYAAVAATLMTRTPGLVPTLGTMWADTVVRAGDVPLVEAAPGVPAVLVTDGASIYALPSAATPEPSLEFQNEQRALSTALILFLAARRDRHAAWAAGLGISANVPAPVPSVDAVHALLRRIHPAMRPHRRRALFRDFLAAGIARDPLQWRTGDQAAARVSLLEGVAFTTCLKAEEEEGPLLRISHLPAHGVDHLLGPPVPVAPHARIPGAPGSRDLWSVSLATWLTGRLRDARGHVTQDLRAAEELVYEDLSLAPRPAAPR